MRTTLQLSGLLILMTSIVGGCDPRPMTPWTRWYKPTDVLKVSPTDSKEVLCVDTLEQRRKEYRAMLVAQEHYYDLIGDVPKQKWAAKELTNLDKAQTFRFEPVPKGLGVVAARKVTNTTDERTLVEDVLKARKAYWKALDELAQHYEADPSKDGKFKAYVIHTVQDRYRREKTYRYIRASQLPPLTLKPTANIPEANAMYDKAWKLYIEGSRVPALADYDKQREALHLFTRMIEKYPTSTRIALAAFYIGEIYKEYFYEHYLATLWYNRAVTWHPDIPKPVRFQTAVQYDFNLGEQARALRYYRAAIKYEPYFSSNYRYSIQRVRELEDVLRLRGEAIPQDCFEPGEKPWQQREENFPKPGPAAPAHSAPTRPWYDPFGLFVGSQTAPASAPDYTVPTRPWYDPLGLFVKPASAPAPAPPTSALKSMPAPAPAPTTQPAPATAGEVTVTPVR